MSTATLCALAPGVSCPAEATESLASVLRRHRREAMVGTFDTGRYACPYYVWGQGPPLVFIPGISDAGMSFVLPIAQLSRAFRCIAYDLPTARGDRARLRRYQHQDLVAD